MSKAHVLLMGEKQSVNVNPIAKKARFACLFGHGAGEHVACASSEALMISTMTSARRRFSPECVKQSRIAALLCILAGLLLLGGCAPRQDRIYAPHEAGLTLVYEDVSLPAEKRYDSRYQVRVASTKEGSAGTTIRLTYSSFKGEERLYMRLKGGEVMVYPADPEMTLSDGSKAAARGVQKLPPGFPHATEHWTFGGAKCRILGRAQAALPGVSIPEGAGVGVWVETQSQDGSLYRSCFLPDLGEVKTLQRRNGSWVTTSQLVSRGFTDGPSGS